MSEFGYLKTFRLLSSWRWLSCSAIILYRAKGLLNRWAALRCLTRMISARAGKSRQPREYRLVLNGTVFYVDAARGDISPYRSIWVDREYEPDPRYIPPEGGTVLDIGAQVGFFTTRVARWVGHGTIYAVEPDPNSFSRLQACIRDNRLDNVHLIHSAMGARKGTVHLACGSYSSETCVAARPGNNTVEVPCTTLDSFVESHGISRIDLLKVDTEGYELEILQAGKRLALPRVEVAAIEIHAPRLVGPIDDLMRQSGMEKSYHDGGLLHFYLRTSH